MGDKDRGLLPDAIAPGEAAEWQFQQDLDKLHASSILQHRDLLYEEVCKQRYLKYLIEKLEKETAFELGERLKEFYPLLAHGFYPERKSKP